MYCFSAVAATKTITATAITSSSIHGLSGIINIIYIIILIIWEWYCSGACSLIL